GEPQAHSDVVQHAATRGGTRVLAPGAAGVEEHGAAHPKQPKRIPIHEEALLDGQNGAMPSALISQRITPQAGVAAEQDLMLGIELPGGQRVQADREEVAAEIALKVA